MCAWGAPRGNGALDGGVSEVSELARAMWEEGGFVAARLQGRGGAARQGERERDLWERMSMVVQLEVRVKERQFEGFCICSSFFRGDGGSVM